MDNEANKCIDILRDKMRDREAFEAIEQQADGKTNENNSRRV